MPSLIHMIMGSQVLYPCCNKAVSFGLQYQPKAHHRECSPYMYKYAMIIRKMALSVRVQTLVTACLNISLRKDFIHYAI